MMLSAYKPHIIKGMCLFLAAMFFQGCIRENTDDCEATLSLYIKVENNAVNEIEHCKAYLFGINGLLQDVVDIDVSYIIEERPVPVQFQADSPPTVVVWANFNDTEEVAPLEIGTPLSEVALRMGRESDLAKQTGNLYYGMRELDSTPVQEIIIGSVVGRVSITARGISDISHIWETLSFELKTSYDGVNFNGIPLLNPVTLTPAEGELRTRNSDFATLTPVVLIAYPDVYTPVEEVKIAITSTSGDVIVSGVNVDVDGNPIIPYRGQNTNALIDLTNPALIEVHIRITDWETVEQWVIW